VSEFELHPQLARDCRLIGDLALCRALLLDDARYPWIVLVPRIAAVREIYELDRAARVQLLEESCRVGSWMMQTFAGDKLNVAALGNLVPQLHVHHVVRRVDDPAWPGPVWGHSAAVPYEPPEGARLLSQIRAGLAIAADS
jgi:diadenosine tetraphosphate (Ap4A) HIT family hydrolase